MGFLVCRQLLSCLTQLGVGVFDALFPHASLIFLRLSILSILLLIMGVTPQPIHATDNLDEAFHAPLGLLRHLARLHLADFINLLAEVFAFQDYGIPIPRREPLAKFVQQPFLTLKLDKLFAEIIYRA